MLPKTTPVSEASSIRTMADWVSMTLKVRDVHKALNWADSKEANV
jgi:hypothetical protein